MSKRIFTAFMTVLMMIAVLCMSSSVAYAKTALKITKQPASVKVLSGQEAKVTVKAKGDGLTYKWYYKNKGAKKYTLSKTVKKSTYTVKMKDSANGRKVYCVVTDKYGNKVKSKAVTLSKGTAVKLTKKPASVTEDCGETAKVKLTAKGDGLTYKWYYKNKGDKKYTLSKNVKTATYSVEMKSSVDGRRVYCVITDAYGKKVKTDSVKLTLKHVYDRGKVTKKATCKATGTKVYTCKSCNKTKTETLAKTDHSYEGWKTYLEPTVTSKGVERNKCKNCTYYKDRSTDKLKAVTYITLKLDTDRTEKIGVASDGKYSLAAPSKVGYNFKGWKDASGNDFPASGTYKSNITLTAEWELDGTNTLAELVERTDAGLGEIKITGNITVNKPVFISRETKIYSDADYTIKRDPSYKGDIFVVGRDRNGTMASTVQKKAVLDLGGGQGTLTIDGNRDNLKVDVVGSALFVADSSVVNIYDGVKIINNKKVGNERALTYSADVIGSIVEKAGGSALLILNSTVNIYGGLFENNAVATEYTVVENEDGTTSSLELNGCGGAIFNVGNINMYGGKVLNNEALRGGGIYSARIMNLFAGEISGNTGYVYGGGVSSSSGADADTFIGTADGENEMIFDGNHSKTGGALYSNTSSPIIIYGNARFTNNTSESGGGAIHTAGPLTVRGSVFEGNSTLGSGGAIYHAYVKESFERRLFELTDCVLEDNSASLGGAVILSASNSVAEKNQGTYATITDCTFSNNKAVKTETNVGNGGALYVTRKSEAVISGCSFTGNTAVSNGGALSVQSASKAQLTDCSLTGNQSPAGGAVYSSNDTTLNLKNVQFTDNKAVKKESGSDGNGGALYINVANVSFKNVDFDNNSAENHAGAAYVCASDLTVDSSCSFTGNSAVNHGGAFYLTYRTVDGVKDGAILTATGVSFENNSAMAGGAISARTDCGANLDSVTFKGNSVEGYANKADGDGEGGGAIYVGYGEINLTNVTAMGNTAADFGGVIDAAGALVTVNGGSFTGNTSNTGGAIYALSGSDVKINGADFTENESLYVQSGTYNSAVGGGAVSVKSGKLTVTASSFDRNKSGYYGGAVHTSKTDVIIDGETEFSANEGGTGGAIYFSGSDVTLKNISFTDNVSGLNGVIYASGTLNAENITATGNKAVSGGVLYVSGTSTVAEIKGSSFSGNNASNGGVAYAKEATLNINNCQISENSAKLGGALYTEKGIFNIKASVFDKNTASSNGGAIDLVAGTANISENTSFTQNSAASHGGAIYLNYTKKVAATDTTPEIPAVYSSFTVDGCKFEGNNAMAGGAISIRTGSVATFNGTEFTANISEGHDGKADGDADGGGAIYVGYGTVNLNNVIATDNETKESVYVNDEGKEKLYGFGGFIDGYNAEVYMKGGTVSGSKAPSGGAVNIVGSNNILSVDGTSFSGNESFYVQSGTYDSTKGGGAIYASKATVTVNNASFDGNSTKWYGGTAIFSGSEVTISKSSFTNSTGSTGAALNFYSSKAVAITDTQINNNTSSGNGVLYANASVLTLDNVTATGNKASKGGLIYTSGASTTFDINGGSFTGNTAANGGVAFTENATLDFNGSVISGNTASSNGGAVYAKEGSSAKLYFTDCEVSSNTAKSGGVIYTEPGAAVSVSDTEFTQNTASTNGGAIYVKEATALTVNGSAFNSNYSKSNGGALYAYRTPVALIDSSFTKNSTDAHGGAINNIGSVITATGNNTFTENTAVNHGGAIYVTYISAKAATETEPAIEAAVGVINFTGGTFTGNTAKGGGAFSVRTGCEANLTGTVLTGNSVEGYADKNDGDGEGGGAIYVGFGTVSLTDVTATGNEAKESLYVNDKEEEKLYGYGGFLDGYHATVSITGGTISANKAPSGGAINIIGSDNSLTVSGTAFSNNESTYINEENDGTKGGGAIYFKGGELDISGAVFDANKSGFYGGAVNTSDAQVTIGESTVFKNNNSATGAAAYFINSTDATIENVTATDNTVVSNGGVFYANGSTVIMADITATGNTATNGGVLYVSGASSVIEISDSVLNSNSAVTGGVVYMTDASVSIEGCELKENTAQIGGAVYNSRGTLNLSDNDFIGNSAILNSQSKNGNGAAISIAGGNVNADGTNLFSNNTAAGHGGAVYVAYYNKTDGTKLPGVLTMGADVLENNSAMGGGAISARTQCVANLTGTVLTGNSANGYANENDGDGEQGGAIYVGYGSLSLTNVTATGNTASDFGGVVNSVSSDVTVSGGTFENNSSKNGGAVNAITNSDVTVDAATFKANNATGEGGAVYIKGSSSKLIMTDTVFNGNTATVKGGAISTGTLAPNMIINATDCTFEANKSLTAGAGAVEIQNGNCNSAADPEKINIVFTDCSFINNESVKTTGGAVEIRTNSCAKFDGITATGNKANQNGGAIYVTSNYSRVYITGDVNVSGNSGNAGKDSTFIHLYNSNYSNPPRIYTTYGEDAPWYSTALIGGNRSSITFNLTTLP